MTVLLCGIFVFCTVAFCLLFLPPAQSVSAAGDVLSGAGSESSPYLITDAADLVKLQEDVNSGIDYAGVYFRMTDDIDLGVAPYNTGEGWTPIGTLINPFKGVFDGDGHVIKNLYINKSTSYTGLFGYAAGYSPTEIINLGIQSGNITGGNSYVGSIVGYANGINIKNCWSYATVVGNTYVGGIAGYFAGGYSNILECKNYGSIFGSSYAGGIAGCLGSGDNNIQDCRNEGTITGEEYSSGIAGRINGNSKEQNNISTGAIIKNWTGLGTAEAPFLIATAVNLSKLSEMVNSGINYSGKYFRMTADINLGVAPYNTGDGWTPIGKSGAMFSGNFDGDNHTIKNLYIDTTDSYAGLFGYIYSATIKNLGIESGSIKGGTFAGGIVGDTLGGTVYISNCFNNASVSGTNYAGGIAGWTFFATSISNCFNTGSISGHYAGGIVGIVSYATTSIANCYNTGEVSGYNAGGIVGATLANTDLLITNSYSAGKISGNYTSGLLGKREDKLTVTDSFYNSDIVSGTVLEGDLAASTGRTTAQMTGGMTGFSSGEWTKKANTSSALYYPELTVFANSLNSAIRAASVQSVTVEVTALWAGSGTQNDPYLVQSVEDLALLAQTVNSGIKFTGVYFRQTVDLDLNVSPYNTGAGWTPIGGSGGKHFDGFYDGNYKAIKNLYINSTLSYVALFGYVSENGTLKNLGIASGTVTGDSYASGLVDSNFGRIINCFNKAEIISNKAAGGLTWGNYGIISDSYNAGKVTGGKYVGGITTDNGGDIIDCYNIGNITGTDYVGGIAAYTYFDLFEGKISGCYNTGNISGNSYVGGIAGEAEDEEFRILNCRNSGKVTGTGERIGGIVGQLWGTISDCYNEGSIDGANKTGGIAGCSDIGAVILRCYNTMTVGSEGTSGKDSFGGIAGNNFGTISDCYNTGSVIGFNSIGGIAGYSGTAYNSGAKENKALIRNCFSTGNIRGAYNVGGIAGTILLDDTINQSFKPMIEFCYNTGNIVVQNTPIGFYSAAGGIAGENSGGEIKSCYNTGNISGYDVVGGIVGGVWRGSITNCYSTGSVTAEISAGGIVGYRGEGTYSNNFYNKDNCAFGGINGADAAGQATGLTIIQMTDGATMTGFSSGAWSKKANVAGKLYYPELSVFAGAADTSTKTTSLASVTYEYTVSEPSVSNVTAADITYGQSLSDSAISGNAGGVSGTFAWEAPTTKPDAGTRTYWIVFTPDSIFYSSVRIQVQIKINKATPTVSNVSYTGGTLYAGNALPTLSYTASTSGTLTINAGQTLTAGTNRYDWTFTPSDSANYNTVTGNIELIVTKKTPTITASDLTVIYDGRTYSITATTDSNGEISYSGNGQTNAGTYTVTISVAETDTYSAAQKTVTIKINKADATITASDKTVTYNGEIHSIEATVTGGGTITFTNNDKSNAGTYSVIINAAENQNYLAATKTVTLKILKAAPEITVTYTGGTLTYGDALPALTVSGTSGTAVLNINQSLTAGTKEYNYTFTPADTVNYEMTTGKISLTAQKRKVTVTPDEYTGQLWTNSALPAITATVTPSIEGSIILDAGQSLRTGTYEYNWTFTPEDTANNLVVTGKIWLTVLKGSATITASDKTVTYNENTHTITATTNSDGVLSYTVSGASFSGAVKAGEYEITITVSETENFYAATLTVKLTIQKATPVITAPDVTYTYSGNPYSLTASSNSTGAITFSGKDYINVGTYNITVTVAEDENYLGHSITARLVITKRTVAVTADCTGGALTYGDALPALIYDAIIAGTIKLDNGQILRAGSFEYNWTFTPNDTANNNIVTGKISLSVSKATPIVTVRPYTSPLNYGSPLPALQIDSASTQGTVTLDSWQSLIKGEHSYDWTFVPSDTSNYNNAVGTIILNVLKGITTITASDRTVTYDGSIYTISVAVSSDGTPEIMLDGSPFTGAKDAGTYVITIFVPETENYYEGQKTVTLTIRKAAGVITASNVSYIYNETLRTISATVNSGEPLSYTLSGEAFTGAVNAGTYTILISAPENKNYTAATLTVTLTIQKATTVITAENKSVTFNGETHGITATTNSDGTPVYTNNNKINAGIYTVSITIAATQNYTAATKTVTLTIQKATHTVVPDAINEILRYGMTMPSITTETAGGTISFDAGQYLRVGTFDYRWTWRPTDTTNYNTVNSSIILTVLKGLGTIMAENLIVTYNGKPQNITATKTGNGTLSYSGNGQTDAGVYTVTISLSETDLYEAAEKRVSLIINRAAPVITAANKTVTYNGATHSITATVTGGGLITYLNNDKINAGIYTVEIFVEESTNYTEGYAEVKLIINKVTPTITGSNMTATYDGSEYRIAVSTNSDGRLSYVNNGHTNAGVYTVQIIVEESNNFNAANAVYTLRINKANMAVSVAPYTGGTLTYGDLLPEITCDNTNGTVAIDAAQELTGGTNYYSWTFVPFDAENYNLITGTIVLTVERAYRESPSEEHVYILDSKTDSITVTFIEGAEYSLDGINWQKSNVLKGLSPDTEYTVYVRYGENQNYYTSSHVAISVKTAQGFTVEFLMIIILALIIGALVAGYGIFIFSKEKAVKGS